MTIREFLQGIVYAIKALWDLVFRLVEGTIEFILDIQVGLLVGIFLVVVGVAGFWVSFTESEDSEDQEEKTPRQRQFDRWMTKLTSIVLLVLGSYALYRSC